MTAPTRTYPSPARATSLPQWQERPERARRYPTALWTLRCPLDKNGDGAVDYIVYIADNKREISDLSWRFFQIVMQAMMFGLLAAILLSFLLSKTITTPIERITEGARSIAEGNFDQDLGVQSSDEIGELTRSFNYMAHRLKNTVGEVQGERDKLNTLFLHMTDGVAAFTHRRHAHPHESGNRKSAGRACRAEAEL